jgi:hypothetical protein
MQPQVENKTPEKIEQVQTQQVEQTVAKESMPEIKSEENKDNWKRFREQREAERKSAEESKKRAEEEAARASALQAALEAAVNKQTSNRPSNDYNYQETEETEEQRINRKVEEALKLREAKYEEERRIREQQEAPQRLRRTFPDFDKVCSSENLDYLDYHHPEIARPLGMLPDSYEKWESVYKVMRKLVPNTDTRQDQAKLEKNLNKPGSISSSGITHGANAMPSARLDESKKEANWQRMQRTLKGLS